VIQAEALTWLRENGVGARRENGRIALTSPPPDTRIPIDLIPALKDAPDDLLARTQTVRNAPAWTAKITRLSEVQPERVSWLWPGYIPLGKLAVIDGDPGMGKSTLFFDIAARVSTGGPMPDGAHADVRGPAGVVILSAEDGLADTVRPRLDAAGADVERIVALDAMESGEKERGVTLADLDGIEEAIVQADARLVIIDPLMAYLGGDTNSYRDQDVRGVLAPLARLAEKHGVAIVIVRHLSKGGQANVLYRGGGSIGIIGAVRSGLMVGRDPEDPEGPRRILAVSKSNLAAFPPAMAYHMEEAGNGTARIVWEGTSHHTAAAITATMQPDDGEERTERDEAADAIRAALADGRRVQKDVLKEVREITGCSDSTIQRARRRLGVKSDREGFGPGSQVYWRLPDVWDGEQHDAYMSHTVHTSHPSESDMYEKYVTSMREDGPQSTEETPPLIARPTSRQITERDLSHIFPGHRQAATDGD
jgi:hypothetical protein